MELKYKVYDKTTDRMYSSDEVRMRIDLTSQMVKINNTWIDAENEIEAIILPSTGVKDINKKESYLGDILGDTINKEEYGIVKKELDSNNLYVEWHYKAYWGEWTTSKQAITFIRSCEIVGSIYNNPDMIKKEG